MGHEEHKRTHIRNAGLLAALALLLWFAPYIWCLRIAVLAALASMSFMWIEVLARGDDAIQTAKRVHAMSLEEGREQGRRETKDAIRRDPGLFLFGDS